MTKRKEQRNEGRMEERGEVVLENGLETCRNIANREVESASTVLYKMNMTLHLKRPKASNATSRKLPLSPIKVSTRKVQERGASGMMNAIDEVISLFIES